MTNIIVPPPADPRNLDKAHHRLAQPLYMFVNQDPRDEPFPGRLNEAQLNSYQDCLQQILERDILRMEVVSCARTPGLSGQSVTLTAYRELKARGFTDDGDLNQILSDLNLCTEDRTQDTDFGEVPNDLFERASWFYRMLEERPHLPPLPHPRYGQAMCRVLGMGISQPHALIERIFPFLITNPPLGFDPLRADTYRVLVA
ncbi:MAG TPA: hypothetical protein PLK06_02090 [bacterium]|nr:hypothetical protein [bacterium]